MEQDAGTLIQQVTKHVFQVRVPTPTLPPSFETNTYIVQNGEQAFVIDVGSNDETQITGLAQIIASLGIRQLVGIVATHYHQDHTLGIPRLQEYFMSPIYVHSSDLANAANEMKLNIEKITPTPHQFLLGNLQIDIQHVKGHTHGHIHALVLQEQVIFVGDTMAGDGSVWIGPPDGHMDDYYSALDSIVHSGCNIACPGHGAIVREAQFAAKRLKERRMAREEEIFNILSQEKHTLNDLVDKLYRNTIPDAALWVAKRTIQAHLIHLAECNRVTIGFDHAKQAISYHV